MSTAKLVWIVGALAAIIFAFVSFDYEAVILTLLGLAGGFFVDKEHRSGLIIAAIFLSMSAGSGALGDLPMIGSYCTAILTSYGALLAAASVMSIARTTVSRLKP